MLLKISKHIPVVQSLISFPASAHAKAIKKFAFLWVVSVIPVFLAISFMPAPDDKQMLIDVFLRHLKRSVDGSELFVYAVTFIAPLFYMIYEKYSDSEGDDIAERLKKSSIFSGYWITAFISLVVLIFTAVAFALFKSQSASTEVSILGMFVKSMAPYVYFFSLYCWYLTLLDGVFDGDYVEHNRRMENSLVSSFGRRVNKD